MESEATAGAATAPAPAQLNHPSGHQNTAIPITHKESPVQGLHSPPDSSGAPKDDGSDSGLSDLDDAIMSDNDASPSDLASRAIAADPDPSPAERAAQEEQQPAESVQVDQEGDIGEILPDYWSGTVPVFKPTMKQFKDFKVFMEKVDRFGMTSGIIKIIPPEEWKTSLPPLDDLVKQIRVREPIKQDIMGSNGTYRQVNIVHGRSYNLPQWRALCDQSEHQPPARRGERRANTDKPKPPRTRAATRKTLDDASASASTPSPKKTRGRPRRGRGGARTRFQVPEKPEEERPMTPVSPRPQDAALQSVEAEPDVKDDDAEDEPTPTVGRTGSRQARPRGGKQQTVSARRKYSRREGSAAIDEKAFEGWDYKMDISEYTQERCEELERIYWKTLTYAQPLYGADLMGTLFDERTEIWNLNKLPNLLDVLGTKVPGVNTAYLYMGMWKATFAWHLEDVDLYSINYLHFGAPKQWYSISQADARRFEAAMKNIWPTEAKACDQFLRHKGFLISPSHLLQHYNIRVNKCLSYPGEFVVTYPYGYHSGYNLGYNCAEAVNFALESWLPMGKIAKKCECAQAQDSVWVDVYEIERKLRGEETEYEETEEEESSDEDDEDEETNGLPTPPSNHAPNARAKAAARQRAKIAKKGAEARKLKKVKKVKVQGKTPVEPPCCLCPNDIPGAEMLPTDDGRKAHQMCALYIPETFIEMVDDRRVVSNVSNLGKDRLALKCLYCRSKKGACFQCSQVKCVRAYHATCAAAAGVFVEEGEIPIIGEDGTEYKEQAFEFSCRFHRTKRDKKMDGAVLETCVRTREAAMAARKGDIVQLQYYRGDIFAGVVVENNRSEQTLLVDIIPNGDRVEVEWKWLLLPDPADFHLPKASATAIPMPASRKAKDKINATKRPQQEMPKPGAAFAEDLTWAEFNTADGLQRNEVQAKVNLLGGTPNQLWHYIWEGSTDTKDRYTEDPSIPRHNPKSVFLDTLPKPTPPLPVFRPPPVPAPTSARSHPSATPAAPGPVYQRSIPAVVTPVPLPTIPGFRRISTGTYPATPTSSSTSSAIPTSKTAAAAATGKSTVAPAGTKPSRPEKPYVYKPRNPVPPNSDDIFTSKAFAPRRRLSLPKQTSDTRFDSTTSPGATQLFTAQRFEPALAHGYNPKISFAPAVGGYFPRGADSNIQSQSLPQPLPQPPLPHTGSVATSQSATAPRPPVLTAWPPTRTWATSTPSSIPKTPASTSMPPPPPSRPHAPGGSSYPAAPLPQPTAAGDSDAQKLPQLPQLARPQQLAQPQLYHQGRLAQTQQLPQSPQPPHTMSKDQKRPSNRAFVQEIMEKYPFFRQNHNRPTTAYKTPYAPGHGFTNGYEGNFRAHLMATQGSLLGKPSVITPSRSVERGASPSGSTRTAVSPGQCTPFSTPRQVVQVGASSPTAQSPHTPNTFPHASAFAPMQPWGIKQPGSAPLHPAIRPQYQGVAAYSQESTPTQALRPAPPAGPNAGTTQPTTAIETPMPPRNVQSPSSSEGSVTSQLYRLSGSVQPSASSSPAQPPLPVVASSIPAKRKAEADQDAEAPTHPTLRTEQSLGNAASSSGQPASQPGDEPRSGFTPLLENFREFPSVEPNSMALMERMMANLRKASGS